MSKPDILVGPSIRQRLGDATVREVLGHLVPGDCQTCNRPLGPVGLVAQHLQGMVVLSLHHPACRRSAWIDGGPFITGGDTLSYRTQAAQLSLTTIGRRPSGMQMIPALLVHPSLEMAFLHDDGGHWRIATLAAYASGGLSPMETIRIGQPIPGAIAAVRGETLRVQLQDTGQWEAHVLPNMRRVIQNDGGLLLILTTALDPGAIKDERALQAAIATYAIGGWIALSG